MESIPVSLPYRRKLTWRFRLAIPLLVIFVAVRVYLRTSLQLNLGWMPFESIWNPPPRDGRRDLVALVEFLNYFYVFAFALWIRDGFVLSVDFLGLRICDICRRCRGRSVSTTSGQQRGFQGPLR